MRHSIPAVAMALALLFAAPAWAQSDSDREEASERVEAGLTHARAGRYEAAAEAFEQAFKLYPHPEILHNLARAREEMGELSTAWELFRKALDMDPDYTFADDARERIGSLVEALKETHGLVKVGSTPSRVEVTLILDGDVLARHLATPVELWVPEGDLEVRGHKTGFLDGAEEVEVEAGGQQRVEVVLRPVPRKGFLAVASGSIRGARVRVDGEAVGETPLTTRPWPVGTYEVRVEAPGYEAAEEVVVVEPDRETRVSLTLVPLEGADAEAARRAAADGSRRGLAGGILLGGGGAALVAGALLHVSAYKKAQDAGDVPNLPGVRTDDDRFDELKSEAERRQAVAFVGYGLSAVLVGVGTWLVLSDDGGATDTAGGLQWTPTAGPTPDGFGMGATLRF